jgi:hypothetical protein
MLTGCTGGVFFLASLYLVAIQPDCKHSTIAITATPANVDRQIQNPHDEAFINRS